MHLSVQARTAADAPLRWQAEIGGSAPAEFVAHLLTELARELRDDPDHVLYGIGAAPQSELLAFNAQQWDGVRRDGLDGLLSRDGHAAVIYRSPDTHPPLAASDPSLAWHIAAFPEGVGPLWAIGFTEHVPQFLVRATVADMLSAEPLARPAAARLPAALAPLVTTSRITIPDGPPAPPQPPGPAAPPRSRGH
ncbi:DUF317 domain-containing protein [Streptomyces sp. NPDC050085]|uniref:DUF317 domain-containing protein n=1 Tax=Streptomyces sp. NPDC050085 TaxID=3365600 RepID=UPI0037B1065D